MLNVRRIDASPDRQAFDDLAMAEAGEALVVRRCGAGKSCQRWKCPAAPPAGEPQMLLRIARRRGSRGCLREVIRGEQTVVP